MEGWLSISHRPMNICPEGRRRDLIYPEGLPDPQIYNLLAFSRHSNFILLPHGGSDFSPPSLGHGQGQAIGDQESVALPHQPHGGKDALLGRAQGTPFLC